MLRKWFVFLVLFSLLFSSVPALAQSPQPPQPPRPPFTHPAPQPTQPWSGDGDHFPRGSTLAPNSPQRNSPVPVGPSGLSFSYAQTFGVSNVPYLVDGSHLNGPAGLFMDASNSLYVAEYQGSRCYPIAVCPLFQ